VQAARGVALILLLAAWQLAALGQTAPPPRQDFGPDTTSTGVFTGEGITRPGLNCEGSTDQGRTCGGFLASAVDGTRLEVSVKVPAGEGPHPLVAVLHGWGGSKDSLGYIADLLFGNGHAVLRYSARGFGRSWGQVNLSDIHVEAEDLRSMLGQVIDQGRLHLDAGAVGVVGVSYGGGQSWLALVQPSFQSPHGRTVRLRAVVPIVPWSDLLYSLLPNGKPEDSLEPAGSAKLSYINGLYASGLRTLPERLYPNYPDYLIAWHAWINGMEPNQLDPVYRQIIDGLAGYRSMWWQQAFWQGGARERVPVFQIQGLTDDLFPLSEAKRMLLALKSIDPLYPIASYFGDLGHPRASNKPGERAYMLGLISEWFGYYLQAKGSEPLHVVRAAITRPRDEPFAATNVITAETYDALAARTIAKELSGSATLINPISDPYRGFVWDPLVMEASRELQPHAAPPDAPILPQTFPIYSVEVTELTAGAPLLIAGQPAVKLRAASTGIRVQLNVRLFDVAPEGARQLITRGTYMLEAAPGTASAIVIPTYGNVWRAPAGHRLQLEITTLDSPYLAPSRVASVTEISEVRLELPVR
jgi:ABC-2 type transport system ATP-binding protein